MERKITESKVVGYLTPEQQVQRVLATPEQLTNRQEIELLQGKLVDLIHEVKATQQEIGRRWEVELNGND